MRRAGRSDLYESLLPQLGISCRDLTVREYPNIDPPVVSISTDYTGANAETDDPVIRRVEADAQPILYIAVGSDNHSEMEITDYADRYIKDCIQTLPGVAQALIPGERRNAMRIRLDPMRLAVFNLTVQDVEAALCSQNVEIPAGRIESADREFTVQAQTGQTFNIYNQVGLVTLIARRRHHLDDVPEAGVD